MTKVREYGIAIFWAAAALAVACVPSQPETSTADSVEVPVTDELNVEVNSLLTAGLESPLILISEETTAYLGVVIDMPDAEADAAGSAVALAQVIDCSGSMADDQKIDNARFAAASIVESTRHGDEVSVTTFESITRVRVPLTKVDDNTRAHMQSHVSKLVATGSTALYEGLVTGLGTLETSQAPSKRLILISDGIANVGPSTAEAIVAGLPDLGETTISTIGVGTNYDENILTAVANKGHGRFYHLTDPVELAGRMRDELGSARGIAGTGAIIDIETAPGVEVLGAEGLNLQVLSSGITRIEVGNVYNGEQRSVSVRVRVPNTGTGRRLLGNVSMDYHPISGESLEDLPAVEVYYTLTDSEEEMLAEEVPRFMVAADRQRVVQVLIDAGVMIEAGDLLGAQAILRDERDRLQGRLGRLEGEDRVATEQLLELFDDSYVTTDFTAAPPEPVAPDRFAALVDIARQGNELPRGDVANLAADKLRILRNVPYARHGYQFKTADMSSHFRGTGWYKQSSSYSQRLLSKADMSNIKLVRSFEGSASLRAKAAAAAPARPAKAAATGPIKASGGGIKGFDGLVKRVLGSERLSAGDVRGLPLDKARILRNTCFARHGRPFRARDLRAHFSKQSWYRVDGSFDQSSLSDEDQANIQVLREYEQALTGGASNEAMREFLLRNKARVFEVLQQ